MPPASTTNTPQTEPPSRALIIRPSALGDVCRSVMLASSIKAQHPACRVDWLVRREFADAVRGHPSVDNIVEFDRKGLGKEGRSMRSAKLRSFLRTLKEADYDLVIDAQGLARSGLFAWATRAPVRVGYRDAREFAWLGVNRRANAPASMHTVDRMIALLPGAGITPVADLSLRAPEDAVVDERLAGTRYAVIAPTSAWAGKRWPIERFSSLTGALLELGVDRIAVVGGPGEEPQCKRLLSDHQSDSRVINLVGKTSVGDLMATIAGAGLVVANDSAAVHMAVGFDRELVALYGPTRTDLVGPYRRDGDVIQHTEPGDRFQHKDEATGTSMMSRIGLDEVVRACDERLSRSSTRSPS